MNRTSTRFSLSHYLFLLCAMVLCFGCTTTSTPKTFNDRAAVGYTTVAAIYDSTAVAVRAGKLSKQDGENVLKQADTARDAIDIAKTLQAAQSTAADDKLTAAINMLTVLQTYLARIQ